MNDPETPTPTRLHELKPSLPFLVDSVLSVQKIRVATQVRKTHLKLNHRTDPDTNEVLKRLTETEEWLDARIAGLIRQHPAYPWFSRVKGIGDNNIAKVVGLVRVKPSDEFLCPNRECRFRLPKDGATEPPLCPECKEAQMYDPPFADTMSALWKFAGYAVEEDGQAPKRRRGAGKLSYNSRLRTMCFRVGESLMRAGKDGKFYQVYAAERARLEERYRREGRKILPVKALPKDENGKVHEPEGIIAQQHLHMQALRKMIKLFLSCLWEVWREAEGLPTRRPYVIEYLGHTDFIDPWEMVDRPAKKTRRVVNAK